MSNRPRRTWLREQRHRAVFKNGEGIEAPEWAGESMADWNRWERFAFRSINRKPLRPDRNLPGSAGALQTIQIRNKPAGFDLLHDFLSEWPDEWREIDALDRLRWRLEEAAETFYRARDGLEPLRRLQRNKFDWGVWCYDRDMAPDPLLHTTDEVDYTLQYLREEADFPAFIYRAVRVIQHSGMAIHQHAKNHGHAADAARNVLLLGSVTGVGPLEWWQRRGLPPASVRRWSNTGGKEGRSLRDAVPESALLHVLALCEAYRAWDCLNEHCRAVADDEMQPDIGEFGYALDHLADAKTWCAEADRINEAGRQINRRLEANDRKAKAERSAAGKRARGFRRSSKSIALPKFFKDLDDKNPRWSNPDLFKEGLRQVRREKQFTYLYDRQVYEFSIVMDGGVEKLASWVGLQADGEKDGEPITVAALYKWFPGRKGKKKLKT